MTGEKPMLVYEHQRTEDIVKRLMIIAGIIKLITVLTYMLLFGGIGLGVSALAAPGSVAAGGIIGAVIGAIIGWNVFSFFEVMLEWMAQILVSQGQIIDALSRERRG
jgi:hypothetical protein